MSKRGKRRNPVVHRSPNKKKGRVALIHRLLPVEIISGIFEIYVNNTFDTEGHYSKGALLLGAVCRTWRSVAWSTTRLWATIAIHAGPQDSETTMELALDWLERAGNQLLTVDLSIDPSVATMSAKPKGYSFIISIANQYADRLSALHLSIPPSTFPLLTNLKNATALHTLFIDSHDSEYTLDFGLETAPAIASLRGVRLESLIFDQANLTVFTSTEFLYVDEFFQLLESAPNLRTSAQLDIRSRRTGRRKEMKPITHQHLESLNVLSVWDETDLVDFLQKATFTNLSRLEFDFMEGDMPTAPFTSFLERSSSGYTLQELILDDVAVSGEDLVQMLQLVPSLSTFFLASCVIAPLLPLDAFYTKLCAPLEDSVPNASPFLPLLQKLTIFPGPVFLWHLLPSFFSLLQGVHKIPHRPLKKVIIKCLPMVEGLNNDLNQILEPDGVIDDWDILNELVNLQSQGVSLKCQMQRKHGLVDMIGYSSRVLDAYARNHEPTLTEQEDFEIHQLSLVDG